ncbi:MAG: DNA methyltransferase [Bacteroidetes bacterium 4572_128]|nr:MAG: DNA methyltransferase [Bacteroidetes bacterium 4572_128]
MTEYLNKIFQGTNYEILEKLPEKSVDLIFADPPYNLQLKNELYRPNKTKVDGVFDEWDKFNSMKSYDEFTRKWLIACKRVLKDNGTIWVIGSYHNIYRVGSIMQDLGYWFLNDILWIKTNPMPNFLGTRFNNAHETMIWASKIKKAKYTFHYKTMKTFNDDLQMRSDWHIPICNGKERIKHNGKKAHSTQKPEELLFRIILSTSNVGDTVLDPFFGSGTTGAVAKKLQRNFIGIEKEKFYVDIAKKRIDKILPVKIELLNYKLEIKLPKVPFGNLLEKGFVKIGENIFSKDKKQKAIINANASISLNGFIGSIHKVLQMFLDKKSHNGWKYWYVERDNKLVLIDKLRDEYRKKYLNI